jgi:hypothetical protein
MLKKIKILPLIIIAILCGLTAITTRAQTQTPSSADATRTTQVVPDSETVCNQRLEKVLTDLDKADSVIATQAAEIESRKRKDLVDAGVIQQQDKLIALYEKQKGTTISFLWGLIKIRKK